MFTLDAVRPWGRSFDEYQRMFALSDADLHSRILGCADGPAGFNAVATGRRLRVTSCDPLYGLPRRRRPRAVARRTRCANLPLLALGSEPSAHVDPVMEAMRRDGHDVAMVTVPDEFQRGGNQMLRIRNSGF